MDNKYFCGGPTSIVDIILYDLIKYLPSFIILASIVVYLIIIKSKDLSLNITEKILLLVIFLGYSYLVTQTSKIKEMPIFKNTKNRTKTLKDYVKEYLINYQNILPKILLSIIVIGNIFLLKNNNIKFKKIMHIVSIILVIILVIILMIVSTNIKSVDVKRIVKSNGPHLLSLLMLFVIIYLNLNNYLVVVGLILIISLLDFSYVIEGSLENQN